MSAYAQSSSTTYRQDYLPFAFLIPTIALEFELDAALTQVKTTMTVQRRHDCAARADLVLDGHELSLLAVRLNGVTLTNEQYVLSAESLTILKFPDLAQLEIVGTCQPANNTSLTGLYRAENALFTHCEAQGFRKICWFPDRPDVMSTYRVTLRANRVEYPVLLSNGNLVESSLLENGRHQAIWNDPFAKPCYLFALVAGAFACREKRTYTASGRDVLLQIYSDPGTEEHTEWAMGCLERALRWDEVRFGLELDLDRFMLVAARDFNMGAMENKGLNIFNAAFLLADPKTATDGTYQSVEAIIGHEYFHNWTGNRVTCRDWFQLSLKEGLTVFRDQEFTADMRAQGLTATEADSARAVKRIDDAAGIRASQFLEDRGPMAHPIRPESYQEISNFYTATVYQKGSEVIRMLHTLLGEKCFRAGMDEYFSRHDGQAVTCDDFVEAMQWAYQLEKPTKTLESFRRWYSQAGTPRVSVTQKYDAIRRRCELTLSQTCPTVGVEKLTNQIKQPLHIPFSIGMLDASGKALILQHAGVASETVTLELTQRSQTWAFENITGLPTLSLLRNFSAPVAVDYAYSNQELALLSACDTNQFSRWEAGQEFAARQIIEMTKACQQTGLVGEVNPQLIQVWLALLTDPSLEAGYRARVLSLPHQKSLEEHLHPLDPAALTRVYEALRAELGRALAAPLHATYASQTTSGPYSPAPGPSGKRALKNTALAYLLCGKHPKSLTLALQQFQQATNMTDRMAALAMLTHEESNAHSDEALDSFYERWQDKPLVIDRWFSVQASSPYANVDTIAKLMTHPCFTMYNPNRARSVVFAFCFVGSLGFHAADGSGYRFWADQVLTFDAINPGNAAQLARVMDNWTDYIPALRERMQEQLQRVASHPSLSRNTLEIVSKALTL